MNWIPFNCKTHFSLLKAFSKCDKLAQKCKEYGYNACVISDMGSVSGAVNFHQACTKNGIKPILGCDFGSYMLIAKNKDGWLDLIKIVSKKGLDALELAAKKDNLICITPEVESGYKRLFRKNYFCYNYKKHGVYYVTKDEAESHRVILCAGMKTTLPKIRSLIKKGEEVENKKFFESDDFYLPPPQEITDSKKEIEMLNKIADMCESYEITSKPMLPAFDCPDGYNEDEHLTELCRSGWRKRLISSDKINNEKKKKEYLQRIKKELDVIFKAKLSGYFLIVQDIVNEVKRRGWLAGPGRGSAAGCLVSYLIGITEVDPIQYDLLFERFYNEGRNTEDYVSLPDIDVDVPAEHRDEIIEYIKQKYNPENVSQMVTFGRLQGRAAIKEVLRINDAVSFAEMNEITQNIPNEAEISDQLELMEEKSVIRWTLENESEKLKSWVYMNSSDGSLDGPLADLFEQAMTIEGTNKSQGKHAAGVIIAKEPLKDICPMTLDKNGHSIAAFEMNDLESQGHVKFDILGIDLLSKIMDITNE
jgi:DNA polymerase-3 subunit alpha